MNMNISANKRNRKILKASGNCNQTKRLLMNNSLSGRSNQSLISKVTQSNQNESESKTASKSEEINKNESDVRLKFKYLLDNIKRVDKSKKMKLDEKEFIEMDLECIIKGCHSRTFNLNESFNDENELLIYNEFDLKNKGQEDIKKSLTPEQFDEIINSLDAIKSCRDLSFEQICCLIKSFSDDLRQMTIESNSSSFYQNIFEKFGYPGIAANIQLSLFSKWQKTYILGCLNGIFESDRELRSKMFGIIFPEALVRIIMRLNKLKYCEALAIIKPKADNQLD